MEHVEAKMGVVLKELTRVLCAYLGDTLPKLGGGSWWRDRVVAGLSQQQVQHVEVHRGEDPSQLDLAALLRVFDKNWWDLSRQDSLPIECRNYVKELQTVRNRWAHRTGQEIAPETVYRDIDTMQRLLNAIAPENKLVDALEDLKGDVFPASQRESSAPPIERQESKPEVPASTAHAVGNTVRLKSDPATCGAVLRVKEGEPENRYTVFVDGQQRSFYESQLLPDETPVVRAETAEAFHARLSATEIVHPGISSLFSLNAARVDFIPYQFRPVLKFIRADRPRLLIADSVGVGKTIEAGLIYRELQARREMKNVLIICPRPLVSERKWLTEMRRFEERFEHLNGPTLQICIDEMDLEGEWDPRHSRVILPYSLLSERLLYGDTGRRKRKGLLDLDPPPRFDLVIVDEAHHIRNQDTYSHQAVRFFCDHAEAVIFMTATPLQLGDHDLFVLLNSLRPDLVIDEASFEEMAAPNPHINRAVSFVRSAQADWKEQALAEFDAAAATSWGQALYPSTPGYQTARRILSADSVPDNERVKLISDLENLHSFAGIINRTRRRDIGDFTVRKPETLTVQFTPSQKELHDALLAVQARIFRALHGDKSVKFMMTTLRRQAASCIFALAPTIKDILNRRIDELEFDDTEFAQQMQDEAKGVLEDEIATVVEMARHLPAKDPKLEALLHIVSEKKGTNNRRVMLFSSFRHTLFYLKKNLENSGIRVGLVVGGVPDAERVQLRNRFMRDGSDPDAIDVLLFSEVGCEGLDYQFCDALVNYDLPWNPMKIEQRIGRLDRSGQKSETVLIYNLITPDTVDADIYDRCLTRVGVFERSVGECEVIFGDLTKEIRTIAESLKLSEAERREKIQQLSDNKIREVQEKEKLEENQKELFGVDLSDQRFREDIEAASSYWLGPRALQNMLEQYLDSLASAEHNLVLGGKAIKTLRLSQEMRSRLLLEVDALKLPSSETLRQWRQKLKGGEPHIRVTFEAHAAADAPDVELLSPVHPLIQQAARNLCTDTANYRTALVTNSDSLPSGIHPFVIYEWRYEGVRKEVSLRPICADPVLLERLPEALALASTGSPPSSEQPTDETFDALEQQHYELWHQAKEEHRRQTQVLGEHRLRSLETSHSARLRVLQQQYGSTTDEKIRRMRQSQIDAAKADYDERRRIIKAGLETADVHAERIASGILKVEGTNA